MVLGDEMGAHTLALELRSPAQSGPPDSTLVITITQGAGILKDIERHPEDGENIDPSVRGGLLALSHGLSTSVSHENQVVPAYYKIGKDPEGSQSAIITGGYNLTSPPDDADFAINMDQPGVVGITQERGVHRLPSDPPSK